MRNRKLLLAVLALTVGVGAVVLVACGDVLTNVNVDTNQQNQTAPTPAPSASASPTAGGPVATVTINGFGEVCPVGVAPSTGQREVRVGCNLAITVNPRNAQGVVIFDTNITGGAPDFFRQDSGAQSATFTVSSTNPYNAALVGLAAGPVVVSASVRGVLSGATTFTVVP